MTALVPIMMFGWIPMVAVLFAVLPARRAVIAAFLFAWLFLPMVSYDLPGLPPYAKVSATCVGVLLAAAIFDGVRFLKFRPRLVDIPAAAWCLVPFASTIAGGWGVTEALSAVLERTIMWGLPYFIGRLYFTDLRAIRELAVGVFIGGLVYVPLCLLEIRFSPQLHTWVYGFHQHSWMQVIRGGGYRPTVFMQHGLAVGTFMCAAALIGLWLWWSRSVRAIAGVPIAALVLALLGTAVLCKSSGATVLMAVGAGVLCATRWTRVPWAVLAVAAAPAVYIVLRTAVGWDGQEILDLAGLISHDRAESLRVRLHSESSLWRLVQPDLFLGSGRFIYALQRAGPEETGSGVIPDGMWTIALGCNGLVGVAAFVSMLTLPPALMVRKIRARHWAHPAVGAAAVLAVSVALYMCDCLFNAMINPILLLAAGGVASIATLRDPWTGLVRAAPAAPAAPGPPGATPAPRKALPA